MQSRRTTQRSRAVLLAVLALAGSLTTFVRDADALCGCGSGGVPVFKSIKMRGNDLKEVSGSCATPFGTVELRAYQQHLKRQKVCPPDCPTKSNFSYCINQCD